MDKYGRVIGVNKSLKGDANLLGAFRLTGYTMATNLFRLRDFLAKNSIAYTAYNGSPVDFLEEENYKNYVAVNVGCHYSGPWFTH